MQITLTSIAGIALESDQFECITTTTEAGVITILPGHEAMITSLKPGVATITHGGKITRFALGGGVLEVNATEVRILADMIDEGGHDMAEVIARKLAAASQMQAFRAGDATITMEQFVELEQQYLRDIAREQLASAQ
jgi:F-type H+-transporting ATPase subunit epsilon